MQCTLMVLKLLTLSTICFLILQETGHFLLEKKPSGFIYVSNIAVIPMFAFVFFQ